MPRLGTRSPPSAPFRTGCRPQSHARGCRRTATARLAVRLGSFGDAAEIGSRAGLERSRIRLVMASMSSRLAGPRSEYRNGPRQRAYRPRRSPPACAHGRTRRGSAAPVLARSARSSTCRFSAPSMCSATKPALMMLRQRQRQPRLAGARRLDGQYDPAGRRIKQRGEIGRRPGRTRRYGRPFPCRASPTSSGHGSARSASPASAAASSALSASR